MPPKRRQGGAPRGAARCVIIRRKGGTIDVSRDGATALDDDEYRPLLKPMRYRRVTHLFGDEVIRDVDPETGATTLTRVVSEVKRLYQFDDRGRLVCGAGYATRIRAHFAALGYSVGFVDLTPDRGKLVPDWAWLARHREFTPTIQDQADLDQMLESIEAGACEGPPPADLARRVKQDELIRIVAGWIDRRLSCVVQAPPGLGKTHCAAAFGLLYRRAKIAVVVPGRDNFFKTHDLLTRYLPAIGQQGCGKGHSGRAHPRVTVYTHESAHHLDDDTDLMLVDEVHKAMANEVAATLATAAPHAVRVGLTATPKGRGDGTDARLEGLFGPVVYEMTWPEAVSLGLIVPIEVRWLACEFAANPLAAIDTGDVHRRKLHGIWRHDARNELIARHARRHAEAGDQVLILCDKVEHVLHLVRHLPDFTPVYAQQDVDRLERHRRRGLIGADFVPLSPARREELRRAFGAGALRCAIATDVWATGVSFDALAVLFRADARGSAILDEQIPGRVSRVHAASGKRAGYLYDCDDAWDRGFAATAARRRSNYRSKGWSQTTVGLRSTLAR